MDVDSDTESPTGSCSLATKDKKRFEVKKWNAVALWAWDIVVDNCAICRYRYRFSTYFIVNK